MTSYLLCRVPAGICALPLEHVSEVMRPLPLEPLARSAEFVMGASRIRGRATPVIDLGRLIGGNRTAPARFVTLRVDTRPVAVAVAGVLGKIDLAQDQLLGVPPLFSELSDALSALGALDRELLMVLKTARLVSESLLEGPEPRPEAP